MRIRQAMAAVVLMACSGQDSTGVRPPPPMAPSLVVGPLQVGAMVPMELWGAPPGVPFEIYASREREGPGPCEGLVCLVTPGERRVHTGVTDPRGRASWESAPLPPGPRRSQYLEALVRGGSPTRSTVVRRVYGAPCSDALEPNDGSDEPTLGPGVYRELRLCHGDEDWFQVEVGPGEGLRVAVRRPGSILSPTEAPTVSLWGLGGTWLGDGHWLNDQGTPRTVNVQLASAGGALDDQPFDLHLSVGPVAPACAPTPTVQSTAEPLVPDAEHPMHLCPDEVRWFSVDVPAGQRLVATVAVASSDGAVSLDAYDGTQLLQSASDIHRGDSIAMAAGPQRIDLRLESLEGLDVLQDGVALELSLSLVPDGWCSDDHEPNDTPLRVPLSEGLTQALVCPADVDGFAVDLEEGAFVDVQVSTGFVEGSNLRVEFFGPALGRSERWRNNASFGRRALVSGTHEVRISSNRPLPADVIGVPYSIYLRTHPPCVPDVRDAVLEVSGDQAVTRTICPGDSHTLEVVADPGDFVELVLQPGDGLSSLEPPVLTGALWSRITDNVVRMRVSSQGRVSATWSLASDDDTRRGGDYVVRSRVIDSAPCVAEPGEPNDYVFVAEPLGSGTHRRQVCEGEHDWYRIESSPGDHLHLRWSEPAAEEQFSVHVVDGAGVPLVTDGGRTHALTDVAGPVYVWVVGDVDDAPAGGIPYTLDVDILTPNPCVADAYEPNGEWFSASVVGGGVHEGMACRWDADWYAIDLGPGDQLAASVSAFDPMLLMVQEPSARQPQLYTGTLVARTAGRYFVIVAPAPSLLPEASPYALTLELEPWRACEADALEPDDTPTEATPLASARTEGIACPDGPDWFSFWAEVGEEIEITVDGALLDGESLYMAVHDPSGSLQMEVDGPQDLWVVRASQTGLHTLEVWSSTDDVTGHGVRYGLSVESVAGVPCIDDAAEPNNHQGIAAPVALGAQVQGMVCPGDDDWYEVPSTSPGVRLTLSTLGHRVYPNVGGIVRFDVQSDTSLAYSFTTHPLQDCVPGAEEPNDEQGQAVLVWAGDVVAAQGCVGDEDWFQVAGISDEVVVEIDAAPYDLEVTAWSYFGQQLEGPPYVPGSSTIFLKVTPRESLSDWPQPFGYPYTFTVRQ